MAGTKKGGLKFKKKMLEHDPEYYSRIASQPKKPRGGSANGLKPGDKRTSKIAAKGGKASKRGAAKTVAVDHKDIEKIDTELNGDFIPAPIPEKRNKG